MDVFSIFTLLGGVAFFLFGMNVMSGGLEKMAGSKLKKALRQMTCSKWRSLLIGAGITIAIQSSSALTVMLVGFVNSGLMEVGQTIGVIMGSNIGTTLTAWLLSMVGIESDNFFIRLLKPESFSPLFAIFGILLSMNRSHKKKQLGEIMLGFGVLMFGMELMSGAVAPLADTPEFSHVFTAFSNPILGVLTGAVVTGVIQSSAASIGMLEALSLTGGVTFGAAIPIIMGQNIGTCATALISSIGVNRNAKRVAVIHISFNIFGTLLFCAVFYALNAFLHFNFLGDAVQPYQIALFHTLFNVGTTAALLPFTGRLEKLANGIVKEKKKGREFAHLDPHLLASPTLAIGECTQMVTKMGEYSKDFLKDSLDLLFHYSEKRADEMIEDESKLYIYRDSLMPFLIQLCGNDLSPEDSREVTRLLHAVSDFRRIGDHCINIISCATELSEKEVPLPEKEKDDLRECAKLLNRLSDAATVLFEENDPFLAQDIYSLERALTSQTSAAKDGYILRLKQGACPLDDGILFNDILHNIERVSSHHCSIAATSLQVSRNEMF